MEQPGLNKKIIEKVANKGLSQRDLLKTVMSESIFMALSSDDIDEPLVRIDIEESIKTATKAIKKILKNSLQESATATQSD